jgi:hypothetical protein
MLARKSLLVFVAVALAGPVAASPELTARRISSQENFESPKTVCELIDEASAKHALPVEFLTRLIWQESTFRAHVVSPKGAQGIAQFMPATAARRGLSDPFDPAAAIPAAAAYLNDLSGQFGNLGLAAAAYNAGEERVADWLAGTRGLPSETRNYVRRITGRSAAEWSEGIERHSEKAASAYGDKDEQPKAGCSQIAALLSRPGAGSAIVSRVRQSEWAPWGVQVAASFSAEQAVASYASLQDQHSTLIGAALPMVVRSLRRSRGTAPLYEARIPAASREEAENLCEDLRSEGGACVVLKSEE